MCLVSKQRRFQHTIAKENIVVYKMIRKGDNRSIVVPLYQYQEGENVPTPESEERFNVFSSPYFHDTEFREVINDGVLHVFTKKKVASIGVVQTLGGLASYKIVKGYIPKGTIYYRGNNDEAGTKKLVIESLEGIRL